jgi:hypothetical protein
VKFQRSFSQVLSRYVAIESKHSESKWHESGITRRGVFTLFSKLTVAHLLSFTTTRWISSVRPVFKLLFLYPCLPPQAVIMTSLELLGWTQEDIGKAVGLSNLHVNQIFQEVQGLQSILRKVQTELESPAPIENEPYEDLEEILISAEPDDENQDEYDS